MVVLDGRPNMPSCPVHCSTTVRIHGFFIALRDCALHKLSLASAHHEARSCTRSRHGVDRSCGRRRPRERAAGGPGAARDLAARPRSDRRIEPREGRGRRTSSASRRACCRTRSCRSRAGGFVLGNTNSGDGTPGSQSPRPLARPDHELRDRGRRADRARQARAAPPRRRYCACARRARPRSARSAIA